MFENSDYSLKSNQGRNLAGALCYAELGTVIKLSGADYTYLDKAYGALVSFQYSWVSNILVRPGASFLLPPSF